MDRRTRAVAMAFVLTLAFCFAYPTEVHAEDVPVNITYDGQALLFAVPPIIRSSRTFVPIRFVLEHVHADAEIEWDGVARQVTIKHDNMTVLLTIDSPIVLVNDRAQEIDVAPFIKQDRTMVPLRFVGETFGFSFEWDQSTRTVMMSSPPGLALAPPRVEPLAPQPVASVISTGGLIAAPPPPSGVSGPTLFVPSPKAPTSPSSPQSPPVIITGPQAGSVGLGAPTTPVRIGDTFTVDVRLSGVTDVLVASLSLTFDPTLVQVVELQSGNLIEGLTIRKEYNNSLGRVEYITARTGGPGFSGDGSYFRILFRAAASGAAVFTIGTPDRTAALSGSLGFMAPAFSDGTVVLTN